MRFEMKYYAFSLMVDNYIYYELVKTCSLIGNTFNECNHNICSDGPLNTV